MTARVLVRAERGHGGETVATELSGTEPWRPRVLVSGGAACGWARVALVQSRASLLAGDDVRLSVVVSAGACLEIVELGAMVLHDARGGAPAAMSVSVELEPDARLIWLGQPLIVGSGAVARVGFDAAMGAGALFLRGDGVALGRAGQEPGALLARTRIELSGRPVVDETLDTGGLGRLRSPVVAGDARCVLSVTLAGMRDGAPPPGAMQAHRPATLWRSAGGSVEVGSGAARVAERWRELLVAERWRDLRVAEGEPGYRPAVPSPLVGRAGAGSSFGSSS